MMKTKWVALLVGALFLVGAAVIAACVVMWPRLADARTADAAAATAGIVAAAAGVISGIAGAVAAVAAYAAARESHATARDASEALGLAMEPSLKILVGSEDVTITNPSRWGASNLAIEVTMEDGRRASRRLDFLAPKRSESATEPGAEVRIDLGERPPRPWDSPDWRGMVELEDVVVVTYSDERGLLRWRTRVANEYDFRHDGRYRSGGGGMSSTVERIPITRG
ncbi:hypothetical protein [Cellulosimicrobium sp. Marseille-Q8652]